MNYTATDLNPSNPFLAAQVPIVQADITDLPWPNESFEVVILSHVLSFVPDDARAMRELRRVVSSDGLVVSEEPYDRARENTYETPPHAPAWPRTVGDGDFFHLYGRDLIGRWERAGFEIQRLHREAGPNNEIIEARPR